MSTGSHSSLTGSGSLSDFAASLLGTTLDHRFRIDQAIGQGAMGTVFLATQLSVNRKVAVKVLREQIGQTATARFMREARAISQMAHPNIVQLVDFGQREDGLLFLVMEYVEGLRMSRLNKKGRLHPNLALEIVVQICSALAEAHSHGIVHRDLKPSNMLLVKAADGSLQVKVLDFGVAHTYEDADQLTATGVLCGTPAYMAPEQARGRDVTPSVDLYALGVNFYEMLGGFRPFRGSTPVEVAMKQIQEDPPSLRPYVNAGLLPPLVVDVVEELLRKDPSGRPPSATELRQRLLHIRSDMGWGPVLLNPQAKDPWDVWTEPKLAEHGGASTGEDLPASAWSNSWSSRTTPGNTQSGLNTPLPHPDSSGGPSRGVVDSQAGVLVSRHGGGWDAFRHQDAALGTNEHGGGFIDPNVMSHPSTSMSGSHMSLPGQTAGPAEATGHLEISGRHDVHAPPNPMIEHASASYDSLWGQEPAQEKLPTINDVQTIVVEKPVRRGTVVTDLEGSEATAGDFVRYALVAVLAFLVVGVAGLAYLESTRRAPADASVTPPEPAPADVEPARQDDDPNAEKPARPKVQQRDKRRDKKGGGSKDPESHEPQNKPAEPIDLFDDQPPVEGSKPGDPDRKIIIEEAR